METGYSNDNIKNLLTKKSHKIMSLIHSIIIFTTECYLKFFLLVQSSLIIWKGKYLFMTNQ